MRQRYGCHALCCGALQLYIIEVLGEGGHGDEGARGCHLLEDGALFLDAHGLCELMTQGDEPVFGGYGFLSAEGSRGGGKQEGRK